MSLSLVTDIVIVVVLCTIYIVIGGHLLTFIMYLSACAMIGGPETLSITNSRRVKALTKAAASSQNDDQESVIGYRWAEIKRRRATDQLTFASTVKYSMPFDVVHTAVCLKENLSEKHAAPAEECTCGFYSLKDPSQLRTLLRRMYASTPFLFQCQLSGVMFEGEFGTRAERQHVLKVWLGSRCTRFGCRAQSKQLTVVNRRGSMRPMCDKHVRKLLLRMPNHPEPVSIENLRDELQTEFEWVHI